MNRILFIVEGTLTEPAIIRNIEQCFFTSNDHPKSSIESLILPATTNIYTVWKKMEADDWDTDVIEVIKELCKNVPPKELKTDLNTLHTSDYSEIYLFFDYDGHANDIPENQHNVVIHKMLNSFCNESEMGKLYISFPMAEALKDISVFESCKSSVCIADIDDGKQYKKYVNQRTTISKLKSIGSDVWILILKLFLQKVCCLFDLSEIDFFKFRKYILPQTIFSNQVSKYIEPHRKVMLMSAFPEFILDYFGEEFWKDILEENAFVFSEADCEQKFV